MVSKVLNVLIRQICLVLCIGTGSSTSAGKISKIRNFVTYTNLRGRSSVLTCISTVEFIVKEHVVVNEAIKTICI